MSTCHIRFARCSRATGDAASDKAAYATGENVTDPTTGIRYGYAHRRDREDVLYTAFITPRETPLVQDVQTFINAVEAAETRVNARTLNFGEAAFPDGLSRDQCIARAREYAERVGRRYDTPIGIAVHAPSTEGDQRNFHFHLFFADRSLSEDGTAFGKKIRVLAHLIDGPREIAALRNTWQAVANDAATRHRSEHRVNVGRRTDRAAVIKLGPAATAMERKAAQAAEVEAARIAGRKPRPLAGVSVAQLVANSDCVTEKGQMLQDQLREWERTGADKSEPHYELRAKSKYDRWLERQPVEAQVLDFQRWLDRLPPHRQVAPIHLTSWELPTVDEEDMVTNPDLFAGEVEVVSDGVSEAPVPTIDEDDAATHEKADLAPAEAPSPEPEAETTKPKPKPKRERKSRGRMSPEDRRTRRRQRRRATEEEESKGVPIAARETKPVALEDARSEVGTARPLEADLHQLGTPDPRSDAAAMAEPMVGGLTDDARSSPEADTATIDDEVHRVEHEQLDLALAALEPPEYDEPAPISDDATERLEADESRSDDEQHVAALAALESSGLVTPTPVGDDTMGALDEDESRIEAAQLHANVDRLEQHAEVDDELPYRALAWDRDQAMDQWAENLNAGNIVVVYEPDSPPRFAPGLDVDVIDDERHTAALAELEPDASEPSVFDRDEHHDPTARHIDSGALADDSTAPPNLPDIDHDQIEDKVIELVNGMLARIADEAEDDVDRSPDEEVDARIDQSVRYHLYGSEHHRSLADEMHAASRRRIEGTYESEHDLWMHWSPEARPHAPVRNHRMATTATRRFFEYWEPRNRSGRQIPQRRTLAEWLADSVIVIATTVAIAVVTEIEDWMRERHRERLQDKSRDRGSGIG